VLAGLGERLSTVIVRQRRRGGQRPFPYPELGMRRTARLARHRFTVAWSGSAELIESIVICANGAAFR
jgi:hypothetical protein